MAKGEIDLARCNEVIKFKEENPKLSNEQVGKIFDMSGVTVGKILRKQHPSQVESSNAELNVCISNNSLNVIHAIEEQGQKTRNMISAIANDTDLENLYLALIETNQLLAELANAWLMSMRPGTKFSDTLCSTYKAGIEEHTVRE